MDTCFLGVQTGFLTGHWISLYAALEMLNPEKKESIEHHAEYLSFLCQINFDHSVYSINAHYSTFFGATVLRWSGVYLTVYF